MLNSKLLKICRVSRLPQYCAHFELTQCWFSVAKPLVADGSAKSHAMSLAYDGYGLSALDTPLVLQEFVNHGKYCGIKRLI